MNKLIKLLVSLILLLATVSSVIFASTSLTSNNSSDDKQNPMSRIESKDQLIRLLKKVRKTVYIDEVDVGEQITFSGAESGKNDTVQTPAPETTPDFSKTNIQVKGVDEGDIIKTDGRYIYQVNKNNILIIDAFPAEKMSIVSEINPYSGGLTPVEIYLEDDYLVIIGRVNRFVILPETDKQGNESVYQYSKTDTRVLIYDVYDKSKPQKIRTFDVEGNLIASRRIGDSIYTITNKEVINWNYDEDITPQYRDGDGEYVNIPYHEISYCPDFDEPNFMIISGINMKDPDKSTIS